MSFDFHPILEAGDSIRRGQWYVVSPEGPKSSQAPCQRVGACANYVKSEDGGGKILISAGAAPQGLCCDLHQLLITKDSLRWSKVHDGDIPSRYEHAAFTLGSDLYAYAGAQTTGPLSDIWKYQSSSRCWTAVKVKGSIPLPRTYHSSTSYWYEDGECGQFLVFSGGAVGSTPVRDRKVYKFDPDTGEWTTPSTSGTPPTPRQGHIVAVVGNRLFVHGGMSGQQIFNDWHILNLSKWVWSRAKVKGSLSPSLAAHGCAVIGSKLYLFGGLTPSGAASDELYSLDTDNMTMEKVSISGPPPPARLDHAMCTVHLVITTASADCHTPLNSTSTDKAAASDGQELETTTGDQEQLTPNTCTVTLISPEGAESDDFSVASDYEAPVSSKTGGTTTPDDQLLPLNDPNPSQPGTCEFVAGSDDHALVPESDFVHKLSLLNGTVTPDKQLGETQSIPALFVFGGMDTHETVHGDSFVFVPN